MIRLSPERPLADLATATGLTDDAIAIGRPGARGRSTQGKSRRAGAEVSVRVLEESVRATGRKLVLLASELIECCILRRARKAWACRGAGDAPTTHAASCSGVIGVGEQYVEYLGETPSYQSGTRHCMACASAFLTRDFLTRDEAEALRAHEATRASIGAP